jgi:hypothetical protein
MSTSNRLYTLLKLGKESNFKQAIFHSPEFCCILSKKADLVDGKVPLDQLPAGLGLINFYDNFTALNTALPQPQSVDMIAAVRNSQGTSWLPGSLGGTFYPKGYYRSTGVTWEFFGDFSYQATLVDVNLGVNNDQFVTPYTLANAAQWNTKNDAIQYQDETVNQGTPGTVDTINYTGAGVVVSRIADTLTVTISGSSYTVINISTTPYSVIPTSGLYVYLVDATVGNITINLPTAVGNTAEYEFKKIDATSGTVIVTPNGAELIDGEVNQTILYQNTSFTIISNNSNFYITD